MSETLINPSYDENGDIIAYDGFISEDGSHQVVWKSVELTSNASYEVWWCETHDRLYYGGCTLVQ